MALLCHCMKYTQARVCLLTTDAERALEYTAGREITDRNEVKENDTERQLQVKPEESARV